MMGRINPGIRGGLLNLFYAVYEKNADRSLDALEVMGVLVPGGDRTAVRRTAQFFLNSFEDRLKAQKEERASKGAEYEADFKPQRSKDEAKTRRKQILSTIGEDLLSVGRDQPFRFPATFTFVVRAFSVLDGIGKGLNPRFDISEISRPYARELLLEAQAFALPPQVVSAQRKLQKGFLAQNRAVVNLFKGPDRIEDVYNVLYKIEQGQFKPRVRALEVERAVDRVRVMQGIILRAVLAGVSVNVGTVLYVATFPFAANVCFVAGGLAVLGTLLQILKLKKLETKERQLIGAA